MKFTSIPAKQEIEYRRFLSEKHTMAYSHVHPNFELYFCPSQLRQRSVINGTEYLYSFPCVILSAPYTIHSMSSDEEGTYERIVIHFGERVLSHFDASISHRKFLSDASGYLFRLTEEQASLLYDMIYATAVNKSSVSENEKELMLMLFINKLISLCSTDSITAVGASDTYIQEVLKYIIENLSSDLTASDIASKFAVSRSKLDRDFIRVSGSPAHAFIDACRLNKAKEMLISHEKLASISDIAAMCGFKSDTYFYSFFRKRTGLTPLEYRKKKGNNK